MKYSPQYVCTMCGTAIMLEPHCQTSLQRYIFQEDRQSLIWKETASCCWPFNEVCSNDIASDTAPDVHSPSPLMIYLLKPVRICYTRMPVPHINLTIVCKTSSVNKAFWKTLLFCNCWIANSKNYTWTLRSYPCSDRWCGWNLWRCRNRITLEQLISEPHEIFLMQ